MHDYEHETFVIFTTRTSSKTLIKTHGVFRIPFTVAEVATEHPKKSGDASMILSTYESFVLRCIIE